MMLVCIRSVVRRVRRGFHFFLHFDPRPIFSKYNSRKWLAAVRFLCDLYMAISHLTVDPGECECPFETPPDDRSHFLTTVTRRSPRLRIERESPVDEALAVGSTVDHVYPTLGSSRDHERHTRHTRPRAYRSRSSKKSVTRCLGSVYRLVYAGDETNFVLLNQTPLYSALRA